MARYLTIWALDMLCIPMHMILASHKSFVYAFHSHLVRYPISYDYSDDILTQTWFIVLLGSLIALIVFLFGVMILIKRIQFIKQTSLSSIHGMCPLYEAFRINIICMFTLCLSPFYFSNWNI